MPHQGNLHKSAPIATPQIPNTISHFARRHVPGQLVIQYTDHCNGSCPQCGMRKSNPMRRHRLDPDAIRRILRTAAKWGVAAVSFTGGEPLLHIEDLTRLIRLYHNTTSSNQTFKWPQWDVA